MRAELHEHDDIISVLLSPRLPSQPCRQAFLYRYVIAVSSISISMASEGEFVAHDDLVVMLGIKSMSITTARRDTEAN